MAKDDRKNYNFDVRGPVLNLGTSPEKLPQGHFWSLKGIDGRYTDTLRRFPGFAKLTYDLVSDGRTRTNTTDVSTLGNILFFKYSSIQKENTSFVLRGFVWRESSSPTDFYFTHFDTEDNKWYQIKVAGLWSSDVEESVDVVVANRDLIVTGGATTPQTFSWRYTVTQTGSTDDAVNIGDLKQLETGPTTKSTDVVFFTMSSLGSKKDFLNPDADDGTMRFRFRWYDAKRNLFTPISDDHDQEFTSIFQNYSVVFRVLTTVVATRVATGFTKLYCYRTIMDGGIYYLEQIVNFNEDLLGVGTDNNSVDDTMKGSSFAGKGQHYYIRMGGGATDGGSGGHVPTATQSTTSQGWSLGMNDIALNTSRLYDPFFDEDGATPKAPLMASYQELVLAASEPTADTNYTVGSVQWSTLFHNNPENFPVADHFYNPSLLGHKVLTLHDAGEYAFAVREDGVVRFHRDGTLIAVNELYRKIGGTGRYSSTTVGGSLYVVTPLGLMNVDGTSGRQDMVGAVERLIIDPTHYWRDTLGDIHLAFDGELGALCMLNTVKEEIYWLWFQNGAVTSLSDCPFEFVTEGPDPITGGTDRTWFSGPSGTIFYTNFDRTNPVQAMCGGSGDEVFNAQVGGQGDIVTDTDDTNGISAYADDELSCAFVNYDFTTASTNRQQDWPKIPQNLVGFYMYILSGTHKGEKRRVTAISTNWAGSNPPAASHTLPVISYVTIDRPLGHTGNDLDVILDGEKVSFAPVVYKAGFSSMREEREPDLYSRKQSHAMSMLGKIHVGEAKRFRIGNNMQIHEDIFVRPQEQTTYMYEDPGRTFKAVQKTGTTLYPAIEALHGNTDFELRSIQVEGTIGPTEALTDS